MENLTCYLNPSWNNLVFEKRNKLFGAYQLRKGYNKNVVLSLIFCASFTAFSFSVPTLVSFIGLHDEQLTNQLTDLGGIVILPPPPIIPITPPVKPKDPTIKVKNPNLPPKVVTDPVPDEPLPPIKPLDTEPPVASVGAGAIGVNTPDVPLEVVKPKEPYTAVEIMPTYDGGLDGLYKFLGKNLRYPAIDRRNGTEGTVYVQVVINETGNVTNIQVIRGLSATLDEEAKRVISLMKQWKPGIQNQEAVSVKMVVPIKFKLTT